MKVLWSEIDDYLHNRPARRTALNYIDLKNGKMPYHAGFHPSYMGSQALPAILLQDSEDGHEYCYSSQSLMTQFNFSNMVQSHKQSLNSTLTSHTTTLTLLQTSAKLLQSPNGELQTLQTELTKIIEQNRVDISTFSVNCLTNQNHYDFMGNVVKIKTVAIDPQSKKYTQEQLIDRAPHPIRNKKRKRIQKQTTDGKKSQKQIQEQFKLLLVMFSVDESCEDAQTSADKILDVVSLSDGSSYNDLWDRIVADLSLNKEKMATRTRLTERMSDDQFNETIDRIMKEATEYEQQVLEVEEECQQEDEEVEIEEVEQKNTKQQKKVAEVGFEAISIDKKPVLPSSSTANKFLNAVQDSSDLTNFYDVLPKDKFAMQYPFELDQFQKRSILHLEKKESVFVAAHTSAGKTVIAEYGIALALKHKRKVIYTSPIKALSNQKYRQLSTKFDSVGIVTGDVSLNQSASCVIMTTQILRNNLYRGAQMIRDIEWVIFDQIHYINNQQRGVVWEQTIIMLPEHIGLIMLSATVPNYMEFANWVGRTKRRVIYVMKTFHRPVPLEHSLFIFNKFHVIKEAAGRFLKEEYATLRNQIKGMTREAENKKEQMQDDKRKKLEQKGFYNDNRRQQSLKLMNKTAVDKFIKKITKSDMQTAQGREQYRILQSLIGDCRDKKLLPCVVFTFSKKRINDIADKLYSLELTNCGEKSKIKRLFSQALATLKPEDRYLHQFIFLERICLSGYAIHHGDLFPLAKEIVELLFSEGLIKVLFATETFAMGINMPAKTVIFNSIKKVTGASIGQRFLNSSEYVQMSGRAGRRGLDEKGTVIIMVKDPLNLPEPEQLLKMIDHPGQRLQSKFKVTYQIILNLYNSKDINVQQMMRQSFMQDPKFKQFASNIRQVKMLKKQYEQLSDFECPFNRLGTRVLVEEYIGKSESIREWNEDEFRMYEWKKVGLPKFGQVLGHNNQSQLCIILRLNQDYKQSNNNKYVQIMIINQLYLGLQITKQQRLQDEAKMNLKKRIILKYQNEPIAKSINGQVIGTSNRYHYYVYWVRPSEIIKIYSNRLGYKKQFEDSKHCFAEISTELLNPPKHLQQFVFKGAQQHQAKERLLQDFYESPCHACEFKEKHHYQHEKRLQTKNMISETARKINMNQLGLMGSFEGMLKLLNEFNFINENALTLKGRIAREVDIYVTQVIVQAVLDPLNAAELAALLSAFVCDYKPRPARGEQHIPITPFDPKQVYTQDLQNAIKSTYRIVAKIVDYQIKNQAYLNPLGPQELIMSLLNFHLAGTVYDWAMGYDFSDAMLQTKAPEGTVVKTIMRLNILLGNVKSVCRVLGSSDLEKKVDQAVELIRRDIVFCQSLYLTAK